MTHQCTELLAAVMLPNEGDANVVLLGETIQLLLHMQVGLAYIQNLILFNKVLIHCQIVMQDQKD